MEMEGLLFAGAVVQMIPFIEAISQNEATPPSPGPAEAWLNCCCLRSSIDHSASQRSILCPCRDESPSHKVCLDLLGVPRHASYCEYRLGWSYIIAGGYINRKRIETESIGKFFQACEEREPSTHN